MKNMAYMSDAVARKKPAPAVRPWAPGFGLSSGNPYRDDLENSLVFKPWKPAPKPRPAPTPAPVPKPSGGYGGGAYVMPDLSAQQRLLDEMRASAARARAERENAARNAYNTTLGQLKGDYDLAARGINQAAERAQQQAWINHQLDRRDLPQQLAAMGISGGAAETTLAGQGNAYGNTRAGIDLERLDDLAEMENLYSRNKAQAEQALNQQLAAAGDAYAARGQEIDTAYLGMLEKQAEAAQKAASRAYNVKPREGGASLQQGSPAQDWSRTAAYKRAAQLHAGGADETEIMQDLFSQGYTPDMATALYNQLVFGA